MLRNAGRKHERKERAHTHTHSGGRKNWPSPDKHTHRLHYFTETWHLRERSYLCSRWQVGKNSSSFPDLGWSQGSPAPQEERAEVCPSLLPHSCPALQPRVTPGGRTMGTPAAACQKPLGSRCLAPLRPRCSWRPAAPGPYQGPQPESTLASRDQVGRTQLAARQVGLNLAPGVRDSREGNHH